MAWPVTKEQSDYQDSKAALEIEIRNWSAIFEDRICNRLVIAVPLKMYRKFGQLKWILVDQIFKKWPMADYYF